MVSPFQPLAAGQQVADTITECTQIMISLEQLTSNTAFTATLEDLFRNAAQEYNFGQQIGSVGSSTAMQAVAAVTAIANQKKASWEAEALTAESLSIAAAAAQTAAAVFSWAPGINLCVDGAAIAACIAAQVLQSTATSDQTGVIRYITNFNQEVLAQPGMAVLQSWNTAIQNNVINFKKLSLGATDQQIQATLMAITNYLIENNQALTAANYGQVIYNVANTLANNPAIDQAWKQAMIAIARNPTPKELGDQAKQIQTSFPQAWGTSVMIMNVYTSIMAMVDFKTWRAVRAAFQFNFADTGHAPTARDLAGDDPAVVRLGRWASRLKAFGMIVNVAVGVFSVIAIVDTVQAASKFSQAISQASNGMQQYLTTLLTSESAQQTAETGARAS